MIDQKQFSSRIVEYKSLPVNIETVLKNLGAQVKPGISTMYFPELEACMGKEFTEQLDNWPFFYHAEHDGQSYVGFFHNREPGTMYSNFVILGDKPADNKLAYDFVTYIEYLNTISSAIDRLEKTKELNGKGLAEYIDKNILEFGVPEGPANKIHDSVYGIVSGIDKETNTAGVVMKLKETYKEFSGLDYMTIKH